MMKEDVVCIVDDDEGVRNAISRLLRPLKVEVRAYALPSAFLQDPRRNECKCLLLDVRMPEMSGLKLQAQLAHSGWDAPIIFISGHADVAMAVEAMRQGAMSFLEKPFANQALLDLVQQALHQRRQVVGQESQHVMLEARLALLSPREKEVMALLVDGASSKRIAAMLAISARTVEDHRASILKKLQLPTVVVLIGVLSKMRQV